MRNNYLAFCDGSLSISCNTMEGLLDTSETIVSLEKMDLDSKSDQMLNRMKFCNEHLTTRSEMVFSETRKKVEFLEPDWSWEDSSNNNILS